jgi:hypothetical protein
MGFYTFDGVFIVVGFIVGFYTAYKVCSYLHGLYEGQSIHTYIHIHIHYTYIIYNTVYYTYIIYYTVYNTVFTSMACMRYKRAISSESYTSWP